jgi:hypothetical protein
MLFQRGPAYGSLTTAALQGPALTSENLSIASKGLKAGLEKS